MASNKRKVVPMDEENDQNSDTESSSDDEEMGAHPDAYTGNEEVEVDFEGRAPCDPDCPGIAQLLSRLFLKAHISCTQLAEMIVAQNFVGSVIGQCDMEDGESDDDMCEDGTIFGITSVLNVTAKKDKPCIEQVRSYVLEKAEKHAADSVLKHLREMLSNESQHVGFLVNERFINIPAEISVPLLENLEKEIASARQKGMKFNFTYFLMLVKLYRKEARKGKQAEDFLTNAEEEVFCKHAVNTFEYSVVDETDTGISGDWLEDDPTLIPYRKLLLLDAKELPKIIADIKALLSGV